MSYHPSYAFLTHYGRVGNLARHADEMHDLIDAHVTLALKLRAYGPGRSAALAEELGSLLLNRILDHGCKLPEEEIRNLLDLDVRLNVQGLENWLDHAGAR